MDHFNHFIVVNRRWVFRHSSPMYLMKSGTLNSFGIIIFFRTKQTSPANIGSIRLFLSTTLNLSFRETHLSWYMGHVDLSLEGPSIVGYIVT
jgi:hypothetical protein